MLLNIAAWLFVYRSYFVFYAVRFIRKYEADNLQRHSESFERATCCSGKDLSLNSRGTHCKATGYSGSGSGVMP